MLKKVVLALLFLMVFAPVALALSPYGDPDVPGYENQSASTVDQPSVPYKVVPLPEAVSKFQNLFDGAYNSIANVITSLAVLVFAICCVFILAGAAFKIELARKAGLGGIFYAGLGLLIFYSIPFIVGFIKSLGAYFNS